MYDSQSETHRLLLSNLCREVVKLDKNNESGLLSKYLFAVANADAYEKLIKLEIAEAIKVYEKAAEDAKKAQSEKAAIDQAVNGKKKKTKTVENKGAVEELKAEEEAKKSDEE